MLKTALTQKLSFRYTESGLRPFSVSKKTNFDFNLDLQLLIVVKCITMYCSKICVIFLRRVCEQVSRTENYLCRNCFHIFLSKEHHDKHLGFYLENKPAVVRMPKETQFIYFKIQSRWFAPIVGFFDLKLIMESVYGCRNNQQKSKTRTIELHKP